MIMSTFYIDKTFLIVVSTFYIDKTFVILSTFYIDKTFLMVVPTADHTLSKAGYFKNGMTAHHHIRKRSTNGT